MRFKGPLGDSYGGAVALVLLALTPYLVLTTSIQPLNPLIGKDLGYGQTGLQLTSGMANAAYAFGAVAGLQLAVRLPVRRLLVIFASLFVIGSVLAAWAPVPGFHVAGRVLQGLMTGAMLIAAVPPLVIGWPKRRLPYTAVTMNLGIFGAVALGPVVGGASAGTGTWRPFFWIVAGLGLLALIFALLTYEDQEPQAPDAPIDAVGLGLAGSGVAAMFFGISFVAGRHLLSVPVLLPLVAGVVLLGAALAWEYRTPDPLMPVRHLVHTLPVGGVIIACAAGASSVALIQLAQTGLMLGGESPVHIGMLFWPLFGGAVLSSVLFGSLFLTRWVPLLPLGGLLALGGAAALVLGAWSDDQAAVVVGSGLIGLGTGASVSPALFASGMSLRSAQLPRVFAMIELLRGAAAFLIGPLLLHLAQTVGGSQVTGGRTATWITMGIALGGMLLAGTIYWLGGLRLHPPRVDAWLAQEGSAFHSPPLLARVRSGVDPATPTTIAPEEQPGRDGSGDGRAPRMPEPARQG